MKQNHKTISRGHKLIFKKTADACIVETLQTTFSYFPTYFPAPLSFTIGLIVSPEHVSGTGAGAAGAGTERDLQKYGGAGSGTVSGLMNWPLRIRSVIE